MRKNAKCVLVALLSFCFVVNVNAAECSYEKQVELNNIASTVKATYEEVEIDTGETRSYVDPETDLIDPSKQIPITEKGFKVSIVNMEEDLYVDVKNDSNNSTKTYQYTDAVDKIIDLGTYKADKVITYTITVKASKGDCAGTELRTITLVTPRYNSYSELSYCENNPNFEYCQEYITGEDISYEEFLKRTENYTEPEKKEEITQEKQTITDKIKEFYKKNKKMIYIISGFIVIVGVATAAIIVIKRRSRLI